VFLSDFAIKRPVCTTMIMCALAVFGAICVRTLGIDLFPRVEFPVVTVVSVLPGADPHTVETTVTSPIEEALSTISSIKHLRSTSAESVSQIVIEFELEKSVDIAFQEVQAKLGTVRSELPVDLEDPVVEKFDIDSSPIMAVVVSGPQPIQELSHIADTVVKNRLQRIKDVGQIKLVGSRDRNMWINLDPKKLEGFCLSPQEVIAAVQSHHIELPGGRIETGPEEIVVKTKAECSDADAFTDLLVAYRNDYPVRLGELGEVVDGLEEERSMARLDGQKAVALLVRRQSGTNTVSVAHAVKEELAKLSTELASQQIILQIAQDISTYIEHSIHEIQFHLIFGGGLAVLVVFLFLRNWRITAMSALAIPLSVISTFIVMNMLGFTMNTITMLALSLAIGILIDDAIVVVENIYRHFHGGMEQKEAARTGTAEIGLAAFAITMSIVAVFLPVAFMKGLIGRFMYQFGLTVTAAVIVSLFVAFTLTPMLASQFLRRGEGGGKVYLFLERIFLACDRLYAAFLAMALRHRVVTIGIACASLVVALYGAKFLRSEFMPMEDQSEFNINVKTPLGSSLATTDRTFAQIRAAIEHEPWVQYTFSTIGTDNLKKVHEGTIYVKMVEKGHRSISQIEAMEHTRAKIEGSPQYTASIDPVPRVASGARKSCAVQVDIKGSDMDQINTIANDLIATLKTKAGYVDLSSSCEMNKPEVNVAIRRESAAALGTSPATIAQAVRAMVGGVNIAKYTIDGDRYDVSLRMQEPFRMAPEDIFQLAVKNNVGELISLGNLVDVIETKGPLQIDRDNRVRMVSVYVNLEQDKKALGQAVNEITAILHEMHLPPGYSFQFSGMADIMKESFANLLFAMVLAVVVVYMVLASQFESFLSPAIIMLSLPFALVGALVAMLVTHATLNINTIIGIIMLMGLVTKNAILLVDYTNTLRVRDHYALFDALIKAGTTRLRPILMTTLAMIFGMIPIALGHGAGSESRAPMAIAIIGGLSFSMVLTLIVVPVVYAVVEGIRERKS
jgi:HAE1 family hydrophobic/amphiphilic exporter-1